MEKYQNNQPISSFAAPVFQQDTLSILNWLNELEEKKVIEFETIMTLASNICKDSQTVICFPNNGNLIVKGVALLSSAKNSIAEFIYLKTLEKSATFEYIDSNLQSENSYCLGVPLKTSENKILGVICVINNSSTKIPTHEINALENLSKMLISLIEQQFVSFQEETRLNFLEKETSVEMYLISPADLNVVFANSNALKSLGYQSNAIFNFPINNILTTKTPKEFENKLLNLVMNEKKSFSTFAEQINQDGSRVLVKLFISFIREKHDSSILIVARNLSKAGFESEFIDYLMNYDHITGLGNRRLFDILLDERILDSSVNTNKSGLLLIDLVNFNFISKTFGHKTGDNVVRQFSKQLVDIFDPEEIICRVSQESFAILLPNCNRKQIQKTVESVIENVQLLEFNENDKKFRLQINIGGIIFDGNDLAPNDYLSLANKACDIAKEFGQYQFYLADTKDVLLIKKHIEIEHLVDIQDAIERDRIILHGQKIARISSKAGKYKEHFEILSRMIDKKGSLIYPGAFIPQLELHGSIISLDKWVLKESLKLIESRNKSIKNSKLLKGCMYNINLSAKSINDESFITYCQELLTQYSHIAACVCFEITETVAISNFKITQNFINIIHNFGSKFAIDDFGSGGASLECVKELSIDFIKIDGSFITDIIDNPISQLIVKSICKIASILKIEIIAEKVETEAVEEILTKFGVHYIQGYKVHYPAAMVGFI